MTRFGDVAPKMLKISTPMPLAGHDTMQEIKGDNFGISTPMPLAGHDMKEQIISAVLEISTPMPLAGHDGVAKSTLSGYEDFYSHAPRGA